jgi:hypothetical protein
MFRNNIVPDRFIDNRDRQFEGVISPSALTDRPYNYQPDTTGAYQTGFKITKMQGGAMPKGSFSLMPKGKK